MTAEKVFLRRVTPADAYALWLWANDEETRIASFGRAPISWGEHVAWLQGALEDPGQAHLLAELPGKQPVGSVRFDSTDEWVHARLSYVIAPEARGRGLSGTVVRAGVEWLRRKHPRVPIRADVMTKNSRSVRVFRKAEWEETQEVEGVSRFWLRND